VVLMWTCFLRRDDINNTTLWRKTSQIMANHFIETNCCQSVLPVGSVSGGRW